MKPKKKSILFFFFLFIIFYNRMYAQDTLVNSNNYKYKIGTKFIPEKSCDLAISSNAYQVYSFGFQVIDRVKHSRFSFETGFYYYNRALDVTFSQVYVGLTNFYSMPYYYHTVSLPVNVRYDTKLFYFTTGVYTDYLLSSHPQHELNSSNFINADSIKIYKGTDRKYNFGINIAVGLEKQINKYLNFFVEGCLLSNLTSTWLGKKVGTFNLTNYGFSIGINYKILNELKREKK